ncbi:DUF5666 domain-containing protein [Cognatishimia sp.]|uniref:DUF5666 domain-containing protein n=1 Tax=Cognatishimia sp. TaxID=2211648 RepID=UPI0035124507
MTLLRLLLSAALTLSVASAALAGDEESEQEGGILGTGILGTVTALGSIFVNGQHIRFAPDLEVSEGATVAMARQLRPGHTVAVIATQHDDSWQASYIRQIAPLVGPVQSKAAGQIMVMGTAVLDAGLDTTDLNVGDWVAVSGLWRSDTIVASRIESVSPDSQAQIEGTVFDVTPGQPLRIGGTEITGFAPRHLSDGDVVRAFGTTTGNALRADRLEAGVFAGKPHVVFSEGYFSVPEPSGVYTLLGSDIVSYTDNPEMIDPSSRQFVCNSNDRLFAILADQNEATEIATVLESCLPPH